MKLQNLSESEISDTIKQVEKVMQRMHGNPRISSTPKKNDVVNEYSTIGIINSINKGVAYVKFEDQPGRFAPIVIKQLKPSEDGKYWVSTF